MFDLDTKEYFRDVFKTTGWDKVYKKGETINMEDNPGDYIYFIIRGKVVYIMHDGAGTDRIVLLLDDGDIFGEVEMFADEQNRVTSETLEYSVLKMIPKGDFLHLLKENNDLSIAVVKSLANKLGRLVQNLETLSFDNAYRRVAASLLMIYDRYGKKQGNGYTGPGLRLSMEDICRMAGVGQAGASEVLNEFAGLGVLQGSDGFYTIERPEILRQWAKPAAGKRIL